VPASLSKVSGQSAGALNRMIESTVLPDGLIFYLSQ
jgi:hypothetical protein